MTFIIVSIIIVFSIALAYIPVMNHPELLPLFAPLTVVIFIIISFFTFLVKEK